jgi:hypothetical protein
MAAGLTLLFESRLPTPDVLIVLPKIKLKCLPRLRIGLDPKLSGNNLAISRQPKTWSLNDENKSYIKFSDALC